MGFFDTLGKAAGKFKEYAEKEQARVVREVERNERRFSNKSDRDLAKIAKDESRPYLERVGAAEAYKKRKQGE